MRDLSARIPHVRSRNFVVKNVGWIWHVYVIWALVNDLWFECRWLFSVVLASFIGIKFVCWVIVSTGVLIPKLKGYFQDRLRAVLPDRVQSFWDNMSYSMEQSQHLRDAAEEQIQFFTVLCRFEFVKSYFSKLLSQEFFGSSGEFVVNNFTWSGWRCIVSYSFSFCMVSYSLFLLLWILLKFRKNKI